MPTMLRASGLSAWATWYADWQSHKLVLRRSDRDHVEKLGVSRFSPQRRLAHLLLLYQRLFHRQCAVFSVKAALLDRDDHQRHISHTESPWFPKKRMSSTASCPISSSPSATIGDNGRLDIWYGAADDRLRQGEREAPRPYARVDHGAPAPPFIRAVQNPILAARGEGFERRNVFNPAAIDLNGSIYILYRAMDASNTSTIGLAISERRHHYRRASRRTNAIYRVSILKMKHGSPTGNSGCEDSRIVRIGDTLFMTDTVTTTYERLPGVISSIRVADFLARRFEKWRHSLSPHA